MRRCDMGKGNWVKCEEGLPEPPKRQFRLRSNCPGCGTEIVYDLGTKIRNRVAAQCKRCGYRRDRGCDE